MLTQKLVQKMFDYKNGMLFHKVASSKRKIGSRAGSIAFGYSTKINEGNIYRSISVNNKTYLEHRIIFLWNKGYLPILVDHILDDLNKEGIKSNYIENLRDATAAQNGQKARRFNKKANNIEYRGVAKPLGTKGYTVNIASKYYGRYETELEASRVYDKNVIEIYGKNALLNHSLKDYLEGGCCYDVIFNDLTTKRKWVT